MSSPSHQVIPGEGIITCDGLADNALDQYSWLTTCIYIAVLIVEYPTNWMIQRVPIAKYLSINIVLWSATLALHAACTNFGSILAVRTLLGIFEAVCQPSFLVMSSMWYKREEQAQTVTYWYMVSQQHRVLKDQAG